jgi:hypothetical protein
MSSSADRATTPCRVSQSTAAVLDSDGIDRQAITLHAHDTPCGHVDRDTSVTMSAEEIVELLADRDVAVRGCDYCGRHLR